MSEEPFHQEGAVWIVWRPNGRKGLGSTTKTLGWPDNYLKVYNR
jgi:hypothetical protein